MYERAAANFPPIPAAPLDIYSKNIFQKSPHRISKQSAHQTGGGGGGSRTSKESSSETESVDLDLMNVLNDIRKELGSSRKTAPTLSETIDAGTVQSLPDDFSGAAQKKAHSPILGVRRHASGAIDIEKSLQELRERAKARESLAKRYAPTIQGDDSTVTNMTSTVTNTPSSSSSSAIEINEASSTAAASNSAKLFERARELEKRQQQDEKDKLETNTDVTRIRPGDRQV